MSGKPSRDKGARGELEFLRIVIDRGLQARKVSRAGYTGPDLIVEGLTVEIKRRKPDQNLSARQLQAIIRETASDCLAWRYDRDDWYVAMPLAVWLELVEKR
jgi:Holliday junction resolvase